MIIHIVSAYTELKQTPENKNGVGGKKTTKKKQSNSSTSELFKVFTVDSSGTGEKVWNRL